ncbi:hypothetical protein RchiOBHm_Chr3g0497051 [Rosa chinensis]|uniref:Uncharacterized protein n=1 Tax=Rosa chinensis TaxID=74649 RepID=A0A2P6RHM7_ROSCH|nr:hypothetical protein RchiOBHm_Chr3g0497051 [Rosa chinensis]
MKEGEMYIKESTKKEKVDLKSLSSIFNYRSSFGDTTTITTFFASLRSQQQAYLVTSGSNPTRCCHHGLTCHFLFDLCRTSFH